MRCLETYMLFYDLSVRPSKKNLLDQKDFIFDLQLFNGEKTEDPTSKRKSDARKKGQVGKSQEINSAVIILVAFVALKVLGTFIFEQISQYMVFNFSNMQDVLTIEKVMSIFLGMVVLLAKTALPIMMTILVFAVVANLYQVGLNFTTEPIMPKLEKLDPISGAKRMFSLRSLVELVKSVLKIFIVGYFLWGFLEEEIGHLPKLIYASLNESMVVVASLIFALVLKIGLVLVILAILDFLYQKWQHKKSLKMSKQEVKDEFKQQEGDPKIKGKIKQKQRAIAMQRMMQEVPKADVIITNPTHFAVALKYEQGMMAPVIVAKGQDLIAKRIKDIAREAKVVIVENKPLARALYATTEVGDVVPEELYKSVAEVLAYVYRLKKKLS